MERGAAGCRTVERVRHGERRGRVRHAARRSERRVMEREHGRERDRGTEREHGRGGRNAAQGRGLAAAGILVFFGKNVQIA